MPQGKRRSHKEHFLNPIMQNKLHIKWIKKLVGEEIPVHSVIVFSERRTLKKVSVESPDVFVINRNRIASTVKKIGNQQGQKLATEKITSIYELLYPYTQVTATTEAQHIADIQKNHDYSASQVDKEVAVNEATKEVMPKTEKVNTLANAPEVEEVVQSQQNVTQEGDSNICPRCGAKLVLRASKKGENVGNKFYGR